MKVRSLLAAGIVIATATATMYAAHGAAAAAVSAPSAKTAVHPVPASAFKSASGHVSTGKIAGRTPTTSARLSAGNGMKAPAAGAKAAGTATASCTEPDCNLVYNGGPVQHTPQVYVVFWGPGWASNAGEEQARQYLLSFYQGLGASPETWSPVTSQYTDSAGGPAFGSPVLAGSFNDTSTPPNQVTFEELGTEAANALNDFTISDTNDAQIVVATQSGTCYEDEAGVGLFAGSCGKEQTTSTNGLYCAFHSFDVNPTTNAFLPWVALPYQPDAKQECGQNFVNSSGTFDGFSMVGGHEYAETITDPEISAWLDTNDNVSGGEIADKCAWGGEPFGLHDPFGDVTLSTGTFPMQSLWSNAAGGCSMTTSPTLTVTTPGNQQSTLGTGASLQIAVTTNTGVQSFKATGLPPGLSINGTTGKISGTLNVTAGTFQPTVTVSDYAKSASVSFAWTVSSTPASVMGSAFKCVDNTGGGTSPGNKIQQWTCNGGGAQQITFTAGGQLQVSGNCITGGSVVAFLEPCTSATNKIWTRQSNGEYVLKSSGACLTEPSTTNGAQLVMRACQNTASQHWSIPANSVTGAVKGNDSKCVDDTASRTTAGNKIQQWTCNGGAAQRITFNFGSDHHLTVFGNCITGGSIDVFLEPCTSATNKAWTWQTNGEYVLKSSGACLTEPSTTNGAQLIVRPCTDATSQRWSLP